MLRSQPSTQGTGTHIKICSTSPILTNLPTPVTFSQPSRPALLLNVKPSGTSAIIGGTDALAEGNICPSTTQCLYRLSPTLPTPVRTCCSFLMLIAPLVSASAIAAPAASPVRHHQCQHSGKESAASL